MERENNSSSRRCSSLSSSSSSEALGSGAWVLLPPSGCPGREPGVPPTQPRALGRNTGGEDGAGGRDTMLWVSVLLNVHRFGQGEALSLSVSRKTSKGLASNTEEKDPKNDLGKCERRKKVSGCIDCERSYEWTCDVSSSLRSWLRCNTWPQLHYPPPPPPHASPCMTADQLVGTTPFWLGRFI